MSRHGFSLIELIVTLGLVAILSTLSVLTIVRFQKIAILDNTASELNSVLHSAQNKSLSGVLSEDEEPEDFEDDGLPQYGVKVLDGKYELFRDSQKVGQVEGREMIEEHLIHESVTISPLTEVIFDRLSGAGTGVTFTLQIQGGDLRRVVIDSYGQIITKKS